MIADLVEFLPGVTPSAVNCEDISSSVNVWVSFLSFGADYSFPSRNWNRKETCNLPSPIRLPLGILINLSYGRLSNTPVRLLDVSRFIDVS